MVLIEGPSIKYVMLFLAIHIRPPHKLSKILDPLKVCPNLEANTEGTAFK